MTKLEFDAIIGWCKDYIDTQLSGYDGSTKSLVEFEKKHMGHLGGGAGVDHETFRAFLRSMNNTGGTQMLHFHYDDETDVLTCDEIEDLDSFTDEGVWTCTVETTGQTVPALFYVGIDLDGNVAQWVKLSIIFSDIYYYRIYNSGVWGSLQVYIPEYASVISVNQLESRVEALEQLEHVYSISISQVQGIWTPYDTSSIDGIDSTDEVGMYRVEAGTGTKHIYTGWLHVSDNDDGSEIIQTLVWYTPALGVWERYYSGSWSTWFKMVDKNLTLVE